MSITYSECVSVALDIQHAMRMLHIILTSVTCLALPYFSTLSHKQHDFRGKKTLLNNKSVLIFSTSSETWIKRDITINVKFTLEQAAKTQKGSRGIPLLFLQPRR